MTALSEREQAVLHHIATGLTQRETARLLDLSESLVWQAVGHLCRKLGASTSANAVYVACYRGLLSLPATDPGREAEEFDAQPAPGFACGRGLGRCKETTP